MVRSSLNAASDDALTPGQIATRSMHEYALHRAGIFGDAAQRVMQGERLIPKQKPNLLTANIYRMLLQQAGVERERIDDILGL